MSLRRQSADLAWEKLWVQSVILCMLALVGQATNPRAWEGEAGKLAVTVILGYIESSSPSWATRDPIVCKNNRVSEMAHQGEAQD